MKSCIRHKVAHHSTSSSSRFNSHAVSCGAVSRHMEGSVRRRAVLSAPFLLIPLVQSQGNASADPGKAALDTFTPMDALKDKDYGKGRIRYPDYVTTPSGLQYKDFRDGAGDQPKAGDTVVIDWDGYTIGYYGRPFEARNKPKGSSFNDDNKEFIRFTIGKDTFIPAFEEAIQTMHVGGIRRIIVPEELGYPNNDWRSRGPRPSTFAGERALGFVLENRGMIDKTLMFDIELKNIIRT